MTAKTDHPFEHLGPAPYQFVGLWSLPSQGLQEANPEAYNRALSAAPEVESGIGTCSHCGTPIVHICVIECGDGKRYGVGSTCVLKVFREPKLISDVKRAVKEQQSEQRAERQAKKRQTRREWAEENYDRMAQLPHPNDYFASQGKTLADYVDFCGPTRSVIATAKSALDNS